MGSPHHSDGDSREEDSGGQQDHGPNIRDLSTVRRVPSIIPPGDIKIAFLGEAPGKDEDKAGVPFIGPAGRELGRMALEAGIDLHQVYVGNTFSHRPPGNLLAQWCTKRTEIDKDYPYPALQKGQYMNRAIADEELARVKAELERVKPNIVVALGNTAIWALMKEIPKVGALRGTIMESRLVPGLKVLPTYHPAAVLRSWHFRPIVIVDLMKALRESEFPEIRRPKRELWLSPTIEDLYKFKLLYLNAARYISWDIETIPKRREITCIGVASDPAHGIVVPFVDRDRPGYHYWKTEEEEAEAWTWVHVVLTMAQDKITQNGLYDQQWMWWAGLRPLNSFRDTMIKHHAIYPEVEKALDFQGSVYTEEIAWKMLRPKGAFSATGKRED